MIVQSLQSIVLDPLLLTDADLDSVNVTRVVIRYVCGISDAYAFQREIKEVVDFSKYDFSAKDLRLLITDYSYLTLNLKFFALNLIKNAMTEDRVRLFAKDFEVTIGDVSLVIRSLRGKFRTQSRASERVNALTSESIGVGSLKRTREAFNSFYADLMTHIRRKTYKKMRFLVRSENVEFSDFNSELLCKAVKAYYQMVPTDKSDAHVLNYLRTVCTNHALNIIDSKTTNKRRRMVNEGADGFGGYKFSLNCVSENQFAVVDGVEINYESMLVSSNMDDNANLIDDVNFDSVLRNYGKTTKRKRIIQILYGHEDPRFTRYLRNRNIIKPDEDSTDFMSRCNTDLMFEHLAAHLSIDIDRLNKFVTHLGTEVRDNRSAA
jgi:DNA-directed RNA polymerase specialized sigma24 family protein